MVMYAEKSATSATADQAADDGFCAIYRKLPSTPSGTIRLFDRQGDYFTAHGQDAIYVATHHYKTQTVIKYLGKGVPGSPQGLPSCTLSNTVAKGFLREALTSKQLRIEIWDTESSGIGNAGGKQKWKLGMEASPGNLSSVEDLLFSNSDILESPIILSLKLQVKDSVKTVGICFADTSEMEMGVSEFVDNDLFSNTESLLIQLGVKEVILPGTSGEGVVDYDMVKIRTIIERCNIVMTDRKKGDFNITNVEQDLNRLLQSSLQASTRSEFDLKVAMASTSALINYLSLMTDDTNFGNYRLKHHDLSQFMKLDSSALRALNLMPDPTGMGGSNKNMSVFGLLNRCRTSQGTRMLGQWLKQPLINLHAIEQRQDLVDCFFNDSQLRTAIQIDFLKMMPDFHRISKRFNKGSANLEDVVRVYQALLLLPGLTTTLECGGAENERWKELLESVFLVKLKDYSANLSQLQEMVETTIDLNELYRHNYVIKPEFDEGLQAIKNQLEGVRDHLDEEHVRVAQDLGMETDNKILHFEQHTLYGYCFRLTRKEGSAIKHKKGYIELTNKTNGVFFTTRTLKGLNDDHKDLQGSYEKKQNSLVKEILSIAASYNTVLEGLNTLLAYIDVIASLATASLNAPISYVKPKISEKGQSDLRLLEARHPCLEVQDGINFIANDVILQRGVSEFGIISGANMGGKSTFIRQTGVIALMAQIGCFVPCSDAQLPVFDSILCRVGAGDSQLKGVSTFMAEMLETAAILKTATKDSLVIIDELGRGTSTYDGFGLAWAISEHLATEIRASVLFATHFHELTALAQEIPHVKNLHVVTHVDPKPDSLTGKEITFLYKIEPGVCDQSFGIHVAELANFPTEVIKLAKRKADDLEDFSENPVEIPAALKGLTAEQTAEGTALVEEMLNAWASAADPAKSDNTIKGPKHGEDDNMENGDTDLKLETQYNLLRKCYEDFKPRLEGTEWTRTVLEQTY